MADLKAAKDAANALQQTALKVGGDNYGAVRSAYMNLLTDSARSYLKGAERAATLRKVQRSMVKTYERAGRIAFDLVAGKDSEFDDDDSAYLENEQEQELEFLSNLWSDLLEIRKASGKAPAERLQQYGNSLDAVFNEMKLRAENAVMLEFTGHDGDENCSTCRKLKGKKHRASWWIKQGLIPGAANANYVCKGFKCKHFLKNTRTGKRYTA